MPFTTPDLATARSDLASRLNDPSMIRWVAAELTIYIQEALRTWNVWTAHYRDQGSFGTVLNQPFYNLQTELPALRGHTVTNWDLVTSLQYSLLEPAAPGGTWTGTDQFTLAQLSSAIQRRRDQFLRETGAVLTRAEIPYAAPPTTGRLALDEAIAHVRRAAWRTTATGALYPLLVTDEFAANSYQRTWPQSGQPPTSFSVSVTPPLTLQLIPPAVGDGTLDLVSINKGAAVDPVVSAALGIPDDFLWVLKYGVLADLLSGDGLALDPSRAAYCESRWQQGIDQARAFAVVLAGRISDNTQSPVVQVPCAIDALADADRYSPLWQLLPSTPQRLLLAGQTLVAVWPPPGGVGGPWTITLDVVRNAPIPALSTDLLQVSQDFYDTILDLAQHAALFKEGPGQLELATALLDRAARAAGIDLRLQQAAQPARAPLTQQQERDRQAVAEQRSPILQGVEVD